MVDEHGLVDLVRDRDPEQVHLLVAEVVSLEQALGLNAECLRRHAGDLLGGGADPNTATPAPPGG